MSPTPAGKRQAEAVTTTPRKGKGMEDSRVLGVLEGMNQRLNELVTRREYDALDKRVLSLEEWRLSETQRAADRVLQIQSQISTTAQQSQKEVADKKALMDERTMQWLFFIIVSFGGVLLGHLWH